MLEMKILLLLYIAGCRLAAGDSTRSGEVTPESILTGPIYQVGDYMECLYGREAKYCMTRVQLKAVNTSSPFWMKIEELSKQQTHFRRDQLYVGICMPSQSIVSNVRKEFEYSLRDAATKLGMVAEVELDQQACQTKQWPPYHAAHLLTVFGIVGVILLALCGSCYDVLRRLQKQKMPLETRGGKFLLCFSLPANWKKIYTESSFEDSGDFRAIQCVRTLIASIFILVHVFVVAVTGPIRNPVWVEESYLNVFWASLYNSSVFLAAFFCISGFLMSFLLLREMDSKQMFKWPGIFMLLAYRYVRLTPVYAVVIAFGASWYIHMGEGPMWNNTVGTMVENCRRHWWTNLLYLNNYYGVGEMCMPHPWYVAADFQCHIVSMLLLILIWKHPRYAKAVLASVLFASILIPFIQTYIEKLDPLFLLYPESLKHLFVNKTFQRAHITFHHNFGGYFVGVIFGYIYHYTKPTGIKCTKMGYFVVWFIPLIALCSIHLISTVFYQPSHQHNIITSSLYASCHRIIVAAGIGTILIGCASGYGGIINRIASLKLFQFLGHFSYCVYLIHFFVIEVLISSTKEPVDISGHWIIYSTFSATVMSYTMAIPLYLLIEVPSSAVFKWLLARDRPKGKQH